MTSLGLLARAVAAAGDFDVADLGNGHYAHGRRQINTKVLGQIFESFLAL